MFNVDKKQRYGILISGGLDSTILLSLLAKENANLCIQPFTIPKSDGAMLYVNNIIQQINKKFNTNIPETIQVGDPTVHHRQQSSTAVKEIFSKFNIDYLYIGINPVPPELANVQGAPARDFTIKDPRIIFPFANYYKDKIISLVDNLDELAEITHSCTELTESRCNVCWQCQERAWAFKQLNKIDIGKH